MRVQNELKHKNDYEKCNHEKETSLRYTLIISSCSCFLLEAFMNFPLEPRERGGQYSWL